MSFLQEFKEFAIRGNVIDLAVAVVIGGAFGKIISVLVSGIIMPLIGLLLGGINITNKVFTMGDAEVKWGEFLQTIIDFTIIAFSIFIVIKVFSFLKKKEENKEKPLSREEILLTEIRDLLKDKTKIEHH
ncbi:large-conductance mechanosensitive channel protein MscL [Legionella longbeachae]|uniref:Large-conductance mechanosensitive channel n=1 Tax=Legionella longbeachae serogroup 1 (strain NSW150) TaxID=661367 RepID=D3HRE8_LEGLN|nr:large-conductance mechanosensitive channel protein MscL [Legionella longbeachae]VEE01981.1 mechanosensitive ion channel MscS [Legionella oakridgensis]HBD7396767.1 large-conductance mechanosensitive channel protein MscL [Legionella pneumophila]ARB91710.1 large-conductance mechanosensitive channel protein MscL [Legionella longbeachae]ARM35146.1 large-conductance mechanosensitive channel protein MscL [Legionella longbeachae]EEZ95412.1 large conductance mechanosensitive channel protein [Legione